MRAVGVSVFSMAMRQQTVVSSASAGRTTSTEFLPWWFFSFSIRRICASCSTGSWVGPSSPTRKASWVQMNFTGSSIRAAMRTAGFI